MTERENDPSAEDKPKIRDEEAFDFLLKQFEQCYIHVRHYQNSSIAIIKFTVAFFSAIGTIAIAVYKYVFDCTVYLETKLFFIGLLILAFLFGNVLLGVFLQLRRTYSRNQMQIIEIRNKIYGLKPKLFDYEKTLGKEIANVKASKLGLHTSFTIFISLINSILLGILLLCFPLFIKLKWLSFVVVVPVFVCYLICAFWYLKRDQYL